MPSTCLQVLKQMALTPVISKHPGTLYQDASNTHSSVCTHRLRGVQGGVLLITFLPNEISTEIPECNCIHMPVSGVSLDYKKTHFIISHEEKNRYST